MATASKNLCLASTTKKNDEESHFSAKIGFAQTGVPCPWWSASSAFGAASVIVIHCGFTKVTTKILAY